MGRANICYVKKNHKEVISLLHDVIKLDFTTAEAWRLLAVVHDELGDPNKAIQANFLSAHLSPDDADLWDNLGDLSL